MTRTEKEKVVDKFLLLYMINEMEKEGIEIDEDKLMALALITQKYLEEIGFKGFSYDDWIWKHDEKI